MKKEKSRSVFVVCRRPAGALHQGFFTFFTEEELEADSLRLRCNVKWKTVTVGQRRLWGVIWTINESWKPLINIGDQWNINIRTNLIFDVSCILRVFVTVSYTILLLYCSFLYFSFLFIIATFRHIGLRGFFIGIVLLKLNKLKNISLKHQQLDKEADLTRYSTYTCKMNICQCITALNLLSAFPLIIRHYPVLRFSLFAVILF